jgi:uncharacterized repeat protein (TIGR01451 family)
MGIKFLPLFRCISASRLVVLCVALLAMAIMAGPAFAQGGNCLQNEYNIFSGAAAGSTSQSLALNCTANDVRVAQVTNVTDLNGNPLKTCFEGSTFSFLADFEIVTSSTSSRSNIGLYFATQNQPDALRGSCVDNIISPQHTCAGGVGTCGSDNYHELDPQVNSKGGPAPDNCGDTSSTDNSPVFGMAAQGVTIRVDNFLCQAPAGSTTLQLPNCTSWQIPGGTNVCFSPPSAFPYENSAVPGTKSKCNCGTIPLPITPVTVTPIVQKACTTAKTVGPATFDSGIENNPPTASTQSPTTCDAGPEGSLVTYTVSITNTSNIPNNNVVVDQVCDSQYGTIFDDNLLNSGGTRVFAACKAGTSGITPTNVSCPPSPIAPLGSATCQFTATVGENVTGLVDIVTASGHSSINATSTFSQTSNNVTVTSTDAPSSATITKGVVATEAACATVRYSVDVANTGTHDENLTLTSLSDTMYGDVTKCTNSGCANTGGTLILGTTCGVATGSVGLGTLSGVAGAGVLPASLSVGGSDYKCQFDAQFCSALDPNSCITSVDKVNGAFTADEAADIVTLTNNTITVKECLTTTVGSTTP